jgi:collagen type VII alpha
MTVLTLSGSRPPMKSKVSSANNIAKLSMENAPCKPLSYVREIAFIDPGVRDVPALLAGLRPEVVPVLLGGKFPAAQVIAQTVRHYEGLDAIHIVVHGRAGELSFSAGALSAARIHRYSTDLAAIGEALGPHGQVMLWSCHAGEGVRGRAFVEALSRAIGAPVAAATGLVGSASLGGNWQLDTRSHGFAARPPLTNAGAAEYQGNRVNLITRR